eukprot:11571062-Ditylum_brightwellii.AAC.1
MASNNETKVLRKTGALMVQEALHTEQIVYMVLEYTNQALMMKDNQNTVQQDKSSLVQQLAEMRERIQNMQNQTNSNANQENTPYPHATAHAVMQQPQMNPHFQQQQCQPMYQQPFGNMANQQFQPFQANNKR